MLERVDRDALAAEQLQLAAPRPDLEIIRPWLPCYGRLAWSTASGAMLALLVVGLVRRCCYGHLADASAFDGGGECS
jgi:hypothetical protein